MSNLLAGRSRDTSENCPRTFVDLFYGIFQNSQAQLKFCTLFGRDQPKVCLESQGYHLKFQGSLFATVFPSQIQIIKNNLIFDSHVYKIRSWG